MSKLKTFKVKLSRLQIKYDRLKNENLTTVDDFLDSKKCTEPIRRTMIKLQLHDGLTHYSDEESDLARLIFYHSHACYSRLRAAGLNLPAISTVRRWVSKYSIEPGFNNKILEIIGEKFKSMPENQRFCALKFDGMKIKAYEEYSEKYDLIEGLCDLGPSGRSNSPATEALLFCLDGLNLKNSWRQPLAYLFTGNNSSSDIVENIKLMLPGLKKVNAVVKCLVTDQYSVNTRIFSLLGAGSDPSKFIFDGDVIYIIYDFPHLIKRLIYHLRKYKYIYKNGVVIASFDDLLNCWKIDQSNNTSQLLGHLTKAHFLPNNFESMNVKRAFQLLSHTVASAIQTAGDSLKSSHCKSSALFCDKMNSLIDANNSLYEFSKQKYKEPFSTRNPHIEKTIEEFIDWSSDWYVQCKDSKTGEIKKKKPPCFFDLQITSKNLINIYKEIQKDFHDFELATGLANQDSVEHMHSLSRGRGGFGFNPTARMYRLSFRHILSIKNIESSHKGNVNCESVTPLSGNKIAGSQKELPEMSTPYTNFLDLQEEEDQEALFDVEEALDLLQDLSDEHAAFSDCNKYEKNAVAYFAGYVAHKCLNKTDCLSCREKFLKIPTESEEDSELFIRCKEFEHNDEDDLSVLFLNRPTQFFADISLLH